MTNDSATVNAEGTTWPTYADRVEMGYKAFEIGLWELGRDNHAAARRWLRDAVDYGVEDARTLLAICVDARTSSPTVHTTPDPPAVPTASSALAAFAVDFAARPAHVRRAAHNWFPRRQLAILRSVALLTIHTRELDRALDRARELDRDRILARDVDRDPVLARDRTNELAIAIAHAHDRALDLKRAVDRDRAGELAQTRDLAGDLARGLARVRDHVLVRDVDGDLAHVLNPILSRAIGTDLARVRDNAFVHAGHLAVGRVFDPTRVRHAFLAHAHARSGDRDRDLDEALTRDVDRDIVTTLATTLAADLVNALELDRGHNSDMFDRELIGAVERLEKALTPVTQPRDGREAG